MKMRIKWLDLARTLAIFFIIFNHCVARTYNIYDGQQLEFYELSLKSNILKAILETISWFGVPLFLMLSGCLIFKKNFKTSEDIKFFYKNNYLPLLISTIIWTFLGYIYLTLVLYNQSINLNWFKNMILSLFFINKVEFPSMWYMDMIIIMYPLLPIFSVFINKMGTNSLYYPCLLVFLSSFILPTINKILNILSLDTLTLATSGSYLFCSYFLFCLIGYFISEGKLSLIKSKFLLLSFFLTFILTIIIQVIGYKADYTYVTHYDSVGILICSSILFELCRRGEYKNYKLDKLFEYFSKNAYAYYMIHIFFAHTLLKYFDHKVIIVSHFITFLFYLIISILLSVPFIFIMGKSKVCKKYLLLKK